MQVRYHLSSIFTTADHQAVTTAGNSFLPGKLVGHPAHMPDNRCLVVSQSSQRIYMALWYYQYMGRRQRVYVPEGHHFIILVQCIAGKLTGHNATENTFHGLTPLLPVLGFALLEQVISIDVIGHDGREIIHRQHPDCLRAQVLIGDNS